MSENSKKTWEINGEVFIHCPVCGHDVIEYDICEECGYQNSGAKEKEGDPIGPNDFSLKEARLRYNKKLKAR